VRDWLYVEDHCEAIWSVIERGKLGETYNVGGSAEATNLELVTLLCEILAREIGVETAELTRLVSCVKDRPGHDLRYAINAAKIRHECGWQPKETLATGLEKTIRWYLTNQTWLGQVRSGDYLTWIEKNYGER
jgi:dTDP-glucose 4,6-dehydratase